VLGAAVLAAASPAHAAVRPVTWCGHDETATNRPDLEAWAPEKVRMLYAVPSDGADRFFQNASGIATDAAAIDAWWRANDPTRAPRFDLASFAGCTSTFGALDIAFVRLPHSGAYYATPQDPGALLDADLDTLGFAPEQKTIVYYDGPSNDPDICGETDYLAETTGGHEGFAYVLLQSGCSPTPGSTTALTAAHELIHNLGAVPDQAPHVCNDSPGHACDSPSDIMWPSESPDSGDTLDARALDVNHDDYYGHSGSWWDVQDSGWLMHLPLRHLHVAVQGHGTLVAGASLPCDAGCDLDVENQTAVSLTPKAAPGWTFRGWAGDCSGFGACAFGMDGQRTVTAMFAPRVQTFALHVVVHGHGRVLSSQPALSCVSACSRSVTAGSVVHLVARAAPGYFFTGWGGSCGGRGACTVRLDRTRSISAAFVRR
jgi:hypothetical protein